MAIIPRELPTGHKYRENGDAIAYLVFTPDGHEYDYLLFGEKNDAIDCANEFCADHADGEWNVYPLFRGEPIIVKE